ncbi:MAG TPA: long-chain fatty acid--CoA ligase [Microthrixaceae bacterium]|nr:long-chain fatty acid--CoA ligase [Microthrixaceae bacterium]
MSTTEDFAKLAEGRTVLTEFLRTSSVNADKIALRWKNADDTWGDMKFAQVAENVAKAAAGLKSLGIGHGDRVLLMMRNIPDFHWLDIAAAFLGATPVSIYNSSAPEQVEYLATHCAAKVAIVEDDSFLAKFTPIRSALPLLSTIVVLQPEAELGDGVIGPDVLSETAPIDLQSLVDSVSPDDIATIIYTSGTTGNPKGVMLSHYNLVWTAESLLEAFGWTREGAPGKRVVSYLPMAHIAERMTSHYSLISFGYEVSSCPETSLLTAYLGEVRPHLMFGVPRVWEKIHAGVTSALSADPERAQKFAEAIEAGAPIRERMTEGTATEDDIATYEFLDAVAFSTVRDLLGLDRLETAVSSAAPMNPELVTWFRTVGVPLAEMYGMSEAAGPMTFSNDHPVAGTVGPAIPGGEVKLGEDGELCYRGGNVFVGYLNEPEKTAETLDEDGWLHSGDIAEIDDQGYVTIVDRKKELIITAGGKNVSPANLEAALKQIPLIGQAAAIGDQRPFVSALVVLDPEVAPVWAAQNGVEFTDLNDLAANPEVVKVVNEGLEEAMSHFNGAERVKKVVILGEEWLPDTDLLTPTSKLKRRGVNARFADEIEGIYAR